MNLQDYLAALAQTKLPLRVRLLLLLAAQGADSEFIQAGRPDLLWALGLKHSRHYEEAVADLLAMRMIEQLPPAGSRGYQWRLRSPEDWLEPRWHTTRKDALRRVIFLRGKRAVAAPGWGAATRPERGQQGDLLPRREGATKRPSRGVAAPFRGGSKSRVALPPLAGAANASPVCLPADDGATRAGGGREGAEMILNLTPEEGRLYAAFVAGAGIEELKGGPLRSLRAIAARANGSLDELCRVAADPFGPGRFLERLDKLRQLSETPYPVERDTAVDDRRDLELKLLLALDAERSGDPEAAAEVAELRQAIAKYAATRE
jgi:hypothetical protein